MLKYVLRNTETHDFPRPEGMSPALHRLLVARGISGAEEAEAFLNPGVHSLHDPLLPLNVEADKVGGCAELLGRVAKLLEGIEGLDLGVLKL